MPTPDWTKALGLFLAYPVLIVATFLIASAAFGFAWWLRGHVAQGRIDALEGQLKLASDQQADVTAKVAELTAKVGTQEETIAGLRRSLSPPARLEELARSNTEIQSALTSLATSTSTLGHILTFDGGLYRVAVEPVTGKSDR